MKATEVEGFAAPHEFEADENDDVSCKKKGPKKSSGGFQGMALSFPVLKGILKRGYKVPTPIQRKVNNKKKIFSLKFFKAVYCDSTSNNYYYK